MFNFNFYNLIIAGFVSFIFVVYYINFLSFLCHFWELFKSIIICYVMYHFLSFFYLFVNNYLSFFVHYVFRKLFCLKFVLIVSFSPSLILFIFVTIYIKIKLIHIWMNLVLFRNFHILKRRQLDNKLKRYHKIFHIYTTLWFSQYNIKTISALCAEIVLYWKNQSVKEVGIDVKYLMVTILLQLICQQSSSL